MVTHTGYAAVSDPMRAGYRVTPIVTARRNGRSTVLPCTRVSVRKDAGGWPRTTTRLTVSSEAAPGDWDAYLGVPGPTTLRVVARVEAGGTYLDIPVAYQWVTVVRGYSPEQVWEVEAADGSWRVDVDVFDAPYSPDPAALAVDEVQDLIRRTWPRARFVIGNGVDLTETVGEQTWTGSPWVQVEALADRIGAEVWQRPDRLWMVRVPPAAGSPSWVLRHGEDGTMVQATSTMEHVPNRVTVRWSSASGVDTVATAVSNDPRFAEATYGRHTLVVERPGPPHDVRSAGNAAEYLLQRVQGGWRKCQVTAAPAPWLEPGDTVQVVWPSGPVERLVVQTVDLDLSPGGTMTLTTRQSASELVES